MLAFLLFFTVLVLTQNQICNNKQFDNINFDDFTVLYPSNPATLPRPFHNFIFKRINTNYTGWAYDVIPIMNVTGVQYYQNAAQSLPNIIFTAGENLSIQRENNNSFNIVKLYMKTIFIDNMPVIIQSYKNGNLFLNQTVNLSISGPTEINLNWRNVDQIIIGCLNPQFVSCAHASYDDITVCY